MSDNWHTLRVPPEAYEQGKEQKEAAGRTWGEQLTAGDVPHDGVNVDALADEIVNNIDATADRNIDELAQAVARQLDYTAIADKVSEQVVRELQG